MHFIAPDCRWLNEYSQLMHKNAVKVVESNSPQLNEYSQLMHKNAVKVVESNSPQSIEQGFIL
ncbi:hypothetical protein KAM622c_05260 [Klebsiella quasipneumoniae subsp. quasipneumoniae]|nr:hypothetical protein KAM622c_05260 [Klebsiella quasipneumoniae subsp. quasipneumoniae]